jgi:hypothetical protein
MTSVLNVLCPHCGGGIEIMELNCKIFRHGQYKDGKQLEPHASKSQCDKLSFENLIHGCGKPFKIVSGNAIKCDYE